ncbi:MAG: lamin tail domain-containing protein [Myxococcales bacterium]|nr:lamin tail domain-containing protein [Myxococcales bacterium]
MKKVGRGLWAWIWRRIGLEKPESYREYGAGFFGTKPPQSHRPEAAQLFFPRLNELIRSPRRRMGCVALAVGMLLAWLPADVFAVCLTPPGDVDATGNATVADVQCLILVNLWSLDGQSGAVPGCLKIPGSPAIVADHNCDGVNNIADTLLAINFALKISLDPVLDANANQCVDACEIDSDLDGDFDLLDCAPLNPLIGNGKIEACNGWDDNCDGVIDNLAIPSVHTSCSDNNVCTGTETCSGFPQNLGLMITEVMIDPLAVADSNGEWFEIYNGGTAAVNINGWVLTDGGGQTHQILPGGALFVPAGAYLVLGNNKDKAVNGQVRLNYQYTGFSLDNLSGSIRLIDKNLVEVDRVDYGGATGIGVPSGKTITLISPTLDNNVAASWAVSSVVFGAGDLGTPTSPNFDVMPGLCNAGTPLVCNDNNMCTDDTCHAVDGCIASPNTAACDDGNVCTTADTCAGGVCVGGPALDCDDANVCTDDSCANPTGCVYADNNDGCDDSNVCTTLDLCISGGCVGSSPLDCDDGNVCTDELCHPITGCDTTFNTVSCADNDACATSKVCSLGACIGGDPIDCNDDNPCTADSCDSIVGCQHAPVAGICDDSDVCTIGESCAGGLCTPGSVSDCDDSDFCTDDWCDPVLGCQHTDNLLLCDDGNECTTGDQCAAGSCQGTLVVCDDLSSCTIDSCNPSVGCVFEPVDCTDGNVCTDDICDSDLGCVHSGNAAVCDDNNACTEADLCTAGVCVGTSVVCDDNSECTVDTCHNLTGCVFTAISCNDNNLCTDDGCDPDTGCEFVPNSVACNDGDGCTFADVCNGGNCGSGTEVCQPEPLPDGVFCEVSGAEGDIVLCPVRLARKQPYGPYVGALQFSIGINPVAPIQVVGLVTEVCDPVCTEVVMPDELGSGHNVFVYPLPYSAWDVNNGGDVLVYGGPAPINDAWLSQSGEIVGNSVVMILKLQLAADIDALSPEQLTLSNSGASTLLGGDLTTQVSQGVILTDIECPTALHDYDGDGIMDTCPYCNAEPTCPGYEDVFCFVSGDVSDEVDCPIHVVRKSITAPPIGALQFEVLLPDTTTLTVLGLTTELCFGPGPCVVGPLPGILDTGHFVETAPTDVGLWQGNLGGGVVIYGPPTTSITDSWLDKWGGAIGETEIMNLRLRINSAITPGAPIPVRMRKIAASSFLGHDLDAELNTGRVVVGPPTDRVFCTVSGNMGDNVSCTIKVARQDITTDAVGGLTFTLPFVDPQSVVVTGLTAISCDGGPPCTELTMPNTLDGGHAVTLAPPVYPVWVPSGSATVQVAGGAADLSGAYLDAGGVMVGDPVVFTLHMTLQKDVPTDAPLIFTLQGPQATAVGGGTLDVFVDDGVMIVRAPPNNEICWVSGAKDSIVECPIDLVRANDLVPAIGGVAFTLFVENPSMLTFEELVAQVCDGVDGCVEKTMPASLATLHQVFISPSSYSDWSSSGGGAVIVFGGLFDSLSNAYFDLADSIVGDPQLMTLRVKLKKNISPTYPYAIRTSLYGATTLSGMDLDIWVQDERLVVE